MHMIVNVLKRKRKSLKWTGKKHIEHTEETNNKMVNINPII